MTSIPPLPLNMRSNDILAIDLSRALSRLEHKILSSPPNPRLQHSSHERTKTSASMPKNLEYARTLLLRLEHESSAIKVQSRKQAAQTSLLRQRALLKRLTDRLHELDSRNDSDASSSSSEDLLADLDPPTKPPPSSLHPPPSSTLRNRLHPSQAPTPPQAPQPQPPSSPIPTLESSSQAQAALTTSLLTLATSLKTSSLALSSSLALDAETLSRATEGLDRNAAGMQAAGKRMGLLKRMSEGRGWWGRMMLYAWIGGLWVMALVVVFVLPKLRF